MPSGEDFFRLTRRQVLLIPVGISGFCQQRQTKKRPSGGVVGVFGGCHIHEHYAPVLEKAERIAKSRKFPIPIPFADATKEADNIQRRKNVLMERIGEDYTGEALVDDMLCFLTKPQETLILLGDTPDSQRVFVLADGQVEGEANEQI